MFDKRVKIFKLLGFEVRLDLSWFFIAIFITWSLSVGLFPYFYKDLSPQTYWFMGIAGHPGSVFKRYNTRIRSLPGGAPLWHAHERHHFVYFRRGRRNGDEPSSPKVEFLMAVAGPATSILLALFFTALAAWARESANPFLGCCSI